jgi:hypothetical protein
MPPAPVIPAAPAAPAAPPAPVAPAAPVVPALPEAPGDDLTLDPFGVDGGVCVTFGLDAFVSVACEGAPLGPAPPPVLVASAVPSFASLPLEQPIATSNAPNNHPPLCIHDMVRPRAWSGTRRGP